MKKLHLELSDLSVESFETTDAVDGRGTVQAHISPRCVTNYTCDEAANTCAHVETCGGWASCYVSCDTQCPVAECQGGGSGPSWCGSDCPDCQTQPNTYCSTNPCLCG
ncbi:MAG TPA: hypothetical protein VHG93_13160 [Longimicrobium sp.]|nr:hypothetical protein [Longimicrobium sp.]